MFWVKHIVGTCDKNCMHCHKLEWSIVLGNCWNWNYEFEKIKWCLNDSPACFYCSNNVVLVCLLASLSYLISSMLLWGGYELGLIVIKIKYSSDCIIFHPPKRRTKECFPDNMYIAPDMLLYPTFKDYDLNCVTLILRTISLSVPKSQALHRNSKNKEQLYYKLNGVISKLFSLILKGDTILKTSVRKDK